MNTFLENGQYTVYKQGEEFYVNGKADTLDFKLVLSETGLPLEAEFNDDFRIIFSELTFI